MDFSEIIVAIIIGLVILAINSLGSKKQQTTKDQPQRRPNRDIFPEKSTPVEEHEEEWDAPRPQTLDEIFQELRRAHEEEQKKTVREEEDYIPRTPKRTAAQSRPQERMQPLEQKEPQVDWRPKPYPVDNPVEKKVRPKPVSPAPIPAEEGKSVFAHAAVQSTQTNENHDTPAIEVDEIDWRKAIIASEILNRKY